MRAPPIGSPEGEGKKKSERKKKKKSARSMKRGCPSSFDGQTGNEAKSWPRKSFAKSKGSLSLLPAIHQRNHRSVVKASRPGRLISRRRDGKHTRTTKRDAGGGSWGGREGGRRRRYTNDKHRTPFPTVRRNAKRGETKKKRTLSELYKCRFTRRRHNKSPRRTN